MEQSLTTQSEENNEVKDKYLKWFVMHKDEREAANLPMNPEEYQKRYGVTHEEIKAIHLSESFTDDIYKYTQRWAKLKVTEMAHILVDNYLKSKSPRDFETYLKFLDIDKGKQTDIGTQNINFFNLSPQQYEQILKRESKRYTGDSSILTESGSGQPDELLSVDRS